MRFTFVTNKFNWSLGINLQKWENSYWCFRIGFWRWVLEWRFRL